MNRALFQYQIKAEPVSTSGESIFPDKWQGSAEVPRSAWARKVGVAAVVLAANTAFAWVPVPQATPDQWLPRLETPKWDLKREQFKYPNLFYADIPRAEAVSIDRWHPSIEVPRWDRKRNQYLNPSVFLGDIPRAESVTIDRWHPELEKPRWDRKRQQYTFPAVFTGDIPRAETVSADRWYPSLEQPKVNRPSRIYDSGGTNPYPIPNVVIVPFDWQAQQPDPLQKRAARIYDSGSRDPYPIPNAAVVTVDWQVQHPLPLRRPASAIQSQPAFVYPVVPFDWQTAIGIRFPSPERREYLTTGVGVVQVPQQAVTLDMWNPAQVYIRQKPVPWYWVQLGEINMVVPGAHMPCILQANANLLQPVGYCATLVQPVGYCAVEVACE